MCCLGLDQTLQVRDTRNSANTNSVVPYLAQQYINLRCRIYNSLIMIPKLSTTSESQSPSTEDCRVMPLGATISFRGIIYSLLHVYMQHTMAYVLQTHQVAIIPHYLQQRL
eukprot:m.82775 g.82775  ORF g.82775 m.82775 type:complete len:111 (+) comp12886_c0_seq8:910-1242(+)